MEYDDRGNRMLWFGDYYGLGWKAALSGKYSYFGPNEREAIKKAVADNQQDHEAWKKDDVEEFTKGWREAREGQKKRIGEVTDLIEETRNRLNRKIGDSTND